MKAVPIDPEAEVLKLKSRVARRHKYTLTPPGPVQRYPFSELMELRRIGHLEYVCRLQKTYGNLVHFRWGPMWLYFVNDPALIERILVKDHHAFVKSRGLRMAKKILGEGLLTSEGQSHRRQRRLMQPAFHKKRLDQYAETMVRVSAATAHRWKPGQQVDMSQEMMRLTLGVVGWTLFDADVEGEAREIGDALKGLLQYLERITSPLGILMEKFPLPGGGKFKQGLDRINQTIYRIIEERRSSTEDRGDLLSMLLMDQDGETMSNQQVRDEAITLFLAGHETTAIALSWAWYEIAKNPEIEAKLHAELDAQLGGRIPTVQDLPNLTYTYKIFKESLRKYPPAFIFGRQALVDYSANGYVIPKGSVILISPYVLQHDASLYEDPETFNPDRWTFEFETRLHRHAFIPFGGGPRVCIGEGFAWIEGQLVLATLAQAWRAKLATDREIIPGPVATLRPAEGIPMLLEPRTVLPHGDSNGRSVAPEASQGKCPFH
jgi:cytochrome P450